MVLEESTTTQSDTAGAVSSAADGVLSAIQAWLDAFSPGGENGAGLLEQTIQKILLGDGEGGGLLQQAVQNALVGDKSGTPETENPLAQIPSQIETLKTRVDAAEGQLKQLATDMFALNLDMGKLRGVWDVIQGLRAQIDALKPNHGADNPNFMKPWMTDADIPMP